MTSTHSKSTDKITRHRPVTSCSECSRRKQKCNKKWPCAHCLRRQSPNLCQFGNTKSKEKDTVSTSGTSELLPQDFDTLRTGSGSELCVESLGTVLEELVTQNDHSHSNSSPIAHAVRGIQEDVLKSLPTRATVDMLVQHFLQNVNWLFEDVHAPSFLEQYAVWWDQTYHETDNDIQFAILTLRICVNSLQFLPRSTETLFDGKSYAEFKNTCTDAVSRLDVHRPRKPTLLRVRHLLRQIAISLNDGDAKESHNMLGEAVKEARGVGLFLETQFAGLTEFEREERRKLFWYLYLWDRFHCTYLGRWPFIPEGYHSVHLPSEIPWSISSMQNAPTQFSDVLLNFKLICYMASFISAPGKESERADPYMIAAHAREFQSQFIDTLPLCFQLLNADTSWDTMIPSLPKKRLAFHISIYVVIEGMHRCFVGPLIPASIKSYIARLKDDEARANLVLQHRQILANSCINVLASTRHLHALMGGGPHRHLTLCVAAIEASAVLGVMIISDLLLSTFHYSIALLERVLLVACYTSFQDGLKLLHVLAQNSTLAQKGLPILEGFNRRISDLGILEICKSPASGKVPSTVNNIGEHLKHKEVNIGKTNSQTIPDYQTQIDAANNVGQTSSLGYYTTDVVAMQFTIMEVDWNTVCAETDISLYLEDWNTFEDGSLPDLFNFGGSFV